MNPKRGFNRIFLVFAILYFIPVAFLTYELMPPTAEEWQRERVSDTVDIIKKYEPQLPESSETYEITDKIMKEGAEKWLAKVHQDFKGRISFDKIEQQYRDEIQSLPHERGRVVFTGLLFWAIPLGVIYLFGIAIRWIIAGFRESK